MPIRDLAELKPSFRVKLEAALADAAAAGLDPLVTETYRTQARQDELYGIGRSRPGKRITDAKHSKHTDRIAADVAVRVNGQIAWHRKDLFDKWGAIAEANGLRWGGRFTNYDGPHVEEIV
jgi:peptidoglycan L-alanyl-D-glutamate endopeptidase CwlK